MDRTVFFACALVLCALPSAFGLMCKMCTPNITAMPLTLCNADNQVSEGACPTEANKTDSCVRLDISATYQTVSVRAYHFGCLSKPNGTNITQLCSMFASEICEMVKNQTGDMSASCTGTCCDTDRCNDMDFPTSPMPTSSTTTTTTAHTGSGPTTIPGSLSQLLFLVIMASLYFGLK